MTRPWEAADVQNRLKQTAPQHLVLSEPYARHVVVLRREFAADGRILSVQTARGFHNFGFFSGFSSDCLT